MQRKESLKCIHSLIKSRPLFPPLSPFLTNVYFRSISALPRCLAYLEYGFLFSNIVYIFNFM